MNRWPSACKADALPTELNPHLDPVDLRGAQTTLDASLVELLQPGKSGGPERIRTSDLSLIRRTL